MTTKQYTVSIEGIDAVDVSVADYGAGRTFLFLHGGAGPQSVTGFAELLSASRAARVLVPTHPGFGGTDRPAALTGIAQLAELYVALIEQLGLDDVTVVGHSIGGWITAEIALRESPRVSGVVLIDATGIEVPGHPVADFFNLSMDEVFDLGYHDPEPFRIDPSTLPPAAQAAVAGNRAALAAYAGAAMTDPGLAGRLSAVEIPTLILWGESDRIVDPAYGAAYAAAIPVARFKLLPETGHTPQIETPQQVLDAIWD